MKLGAVPNAVATGRTPEACEPEALFASAYKLGLDSLELHGRFGGGWEAPGFVERIRALQERYGIETQLSFGDDYITHGANQPTGRFANLVECVCRPLGVTIIGTVSPQHGGRWLRDVPLPQQLDQLAAALGQLAPVAEAAGVTLVVENHADYRGHELASVLAQVDSPAVRARLDTANSYPVIEEPLAAATALAPYTAATHIKDVIVEAEPGNRGLPDLRGLLALRPCALGEGHVDLPAILALLAEQGPRGDDLVLTLEVPADSVAASIAYARQAFAAYLHK